MPTSTRTQVKPSDGCAAKPQTADKRRSKIAQVIDLLKREDGATLDEMIELTGWKPHTTRAAMTGLKKKGHQIELGKRGETTCYWIRTAS